MATRSLLAIGALVLTSSVAWADIAPPNQCARDVKPGAACKTDDGEAGACEEHTRQHYLPPRNGNEPEAVTSKYMLCVAAKTAAPPKVDTPDAAAASSGTVPVTPPPSKRGCNSADTSATSLFGAVFVAGLLWQASRRRSTKK